MIPSRYLEELHAASDAQATVSSIIRNFVEALKLVKHYARQAEETHEERLLAVLTTLGSTRRRAEQAAARAAARTAHHETTDTVDLYANILSRSNDLLTELQEHAGSYSPRFLAAMVVVADEVKRVPWGHPHVPDPWALIPAFFDEHLLEWAHDVPPTAIERTALSITKVKEWTADHHAHLRPVMLASSAAAASSSPVVAAVATHLSTVAPGSVGSAGLPGSTSSHTQVSGPLTTPPSSVLSPLSPAAAISGVPIGKPPPGSASPPSPGSPAEATAASATFSSRGVPTTNAGALLLHGAGSLVERSLRSVAASSSPGGGSRPPASGGAGNLESLMGLGNGGGMSIADVAASAAMSSASVMTGIASVSLSAVAATSMGSAGSGSPAAATLPAGGAASLPPQPSPAVSTSVQTAAPLAPSALHLRRPIPALRISALCSDPMPLEGAGTIDVVFLGALNGTVMSVPTSTLTESMDLRTRAAQEACQHTGGSLLDATRGAVTATQGTRRGNTPAGGSRRSTPGGSGAGGIGQTRPGGPSASGSGGANSSLPNSRRGKRGGGRGPSQSAGADSRGAYTDESPYAHIPGVKVYAGHYNFAVRFLSVVTSGRDGTKLLVSAADDKVMKISNVLTAQLLHLVESPRGGAMTQCCTLPAHELITSAAGAAAPCWRIVAGSLDGLLSVWDLRSGERVGAKLVDLKQPVHSVATVSTGGGSGATSASCWGLNAPPQASGAVAGGNSGAFDLIVVGGRRGHVYLLRVTRADTRQPEACCTHAFLPMLDTVTTIFIEPAWRCQVDENASLLQTPPLGHRAAVTCIIAAGGVLITGAADGLIIVWSATERRLLRRLVHHVNAVHSLAATKDGFLLSASADASIAAWSWRDGLLLQVLREGAHFHEVSAVLIGLRARAKVDIASLLLAQKSSADGGTGSGAGGRRSSFGALQTSAGANEERLWGSQYIALKRLPEAVVECIAMTASLDESIAIWSVGYNAHHHHPSISSGGGPLSVSAEDANEDHDGLAA